MGSLPKIVSVIKSSKWSNKSPWAEWTKEYNPKTDDITMQFYNDALYNYMLEPLGFERYHYVLKSDFEVFPDDQAQIFYNEDMAMVNKFLEGDGGMVIREYQNTWNDLKGAPNNDGYWRYVWKEDGHIYVGGRTDKPVIFKN